MLSKFCGCEAYISCNKVPKGVLKICAHHFLALFLLEQRYFLEQTVKDKFGSEVINVTQQTDTSKRMFVIVLTLSQSLCLVYLLHFNNNNEYF